MFYHVLGQKELYREFFGGEGGELGRGSSFLNTYHFLLIETKNLQKCNLLQNHSLHNLHRKRFYEHEYSKGHNWGLWGGGLGVSLPFFSDVSMIEVRRRAGIERELASRADQSIRWFWNVERIDEYRMARRVLMAEVSGGWVRGRPRLAWMDGVKVVLGNRRMTGRQRDNARKIEKSGEPWYICN